MNLGTTNDEGAEKLSGLTARRLRQLVSEGRLPKQPAPGTWDVFELSSGLIQYYRTAADRMSDGLRGEEIRKVKADADLAELKRDRLRAKLCALDDVIAVWDEQLSALRDAVLSSDLSKIDKAACLATLRAIEPAAYARRQDTSGNGPPTTDEDP